MNTNFLKHGYAYLLALVVTMQLIAAPIALSAEQWPVDFIVNEPQDGTCS